MRIAEGQPCPLCEHRLSRTPLPAFSGDEQPLRVTLNAMPALQCATGHTYFVDPGFPLWLMQLLVDEKEAQLPAGEAKGFILKKYLCRECGGELAAKQDHRHAFRFDAAFGEEPGFEVELSMPVYKCPGCGKEQLHSLEEVRKLTPAALVHAYKGAGIKAPA